MDNREGVPPKFLSLLEGLTKPFIPALTPMERDAIIDDVLEQLAGDYVSIKRHNLGEGAEYDRAEALAICRVASSFAWVFVNALAAKLQRIAEAEGIMVVDREDGDRRP